MDAALPPGLPCLTGTEVLHCTILQDAPAGKLGEKVTVSVPLVTAGTSLSVCATSRLGWYRKGAPGPALPRCEEPASQRMR